MAIDNGQLTMIGATDVSGFEMCWLKKTPTSETVGNGLCAVPGASRIEPVRVNGITQCSGDDSSPRHISTITRAVEWYYAM